MFILCSLYAPIHQNKFQVGVNLLGNKSNSDSDSEESEIHAKTKNCDIISYVFQHIFYCWKNNPSLPMQPPLRPGWEDDTGQQMKSRRLCTVHYRSLAKNET